jgi:hypothetical protein
MVNFTFVIPKIIFPANIMGSALMDEIIGLRPKDIDNESITKQLHKKYGSRFPKIKDYTFELVKESTDYLEILCDIYEFSVNIKAVKNDRTSM